MCVVLNMGKNMYYPFPTPPGPLPPRYWKNVNHMQIEPWLVRVSWHCWMAEGWSGKSIIIKNS